MKPRSKLLQQTVLAVFAIYAAIRLASMFGGPPTAPIALQPPRDVFAAELALAYKDNSVAADVAFKGQSLRVSGTVAAISTDIGGNAVLSFDGRVNQFLQPQAFLTNSSRARAAALHVGEYVTLHCTGAGDVVKIPMLRSCEFSN